MNPPDLAATSPAAWWTGAFEAHQARHDVIHGVSPKCPEEGWVDLASLLEPGRLRAQHAGIRERDGVPANAAAKWLVEWTAGVVASAVGYTLAVADAGVLAGTGRLRVRPHADGWPERVDLGGSRVVVTADHPWAGSPDVEVVPAEQVLRRTRDALVETLTPYVEALRPFGRVGPAALWVEIADAVGMPLSHSPQLHVEDEMVARVDALLTLPGAPWRQRPDLRAADVPGGRGCLVRKAGCCLAYLQPGEQSDPADPALSVRDRAWLERFPPAVEEKQTCTTCSLRDLDDCEERQRFWFKLEQSLA